MVGTCFNSQSITLNCILRRDGRHSSMSDNKRLANKRRLIGIKLQRVDRLKRRIGYDTVRPSGDQRMDSQIFLASNRLLLGPYSHSELLKKSDTILGSCILRQQYNFGLTDIRFSADLQQFLRRPISIGGKVNDSTNNCISLTCSFHKLAIVGNDIRILNTDIFQIGNQCVHRLLVLNIEGRYHSIVDRRKYGSQASYFRLTRRVSNR